MTPKLHHPLFVAILIALALAPTTLAHGNGEHEQADQDLKVTFTIERYGQAELNFEASEGEEIEWSITTDEETPLYVDVHQHDAGVVLHYNETNVTEVRETFVVPADGTYSIFMQRSENPPAEVTLTAKGRFAITGTQGFEIQEDKTTPAVPLVMVLIGLSLAAVVPARRNRR